MRTSLACLALLALPACPEPDPQSDDEATETEGSESDGSDTTDTGIDDDLHGMVKLEITAEDPDNLPFPGTTKIQATVTYQDCLIDFYLVAHPELQQGAVEGSAIFTDWIERLCDPTLENVIPCEVTEIEQTLIDATAVYQLSVEFTITDDAAIQDGWLYVGPLPTAELVVDTCSADPTVEVRANALIGRDAGDAQLWWVKTLPGFGQATTDQGAPLRITVGN